MDTSDDHIPSVVRDDLPVRPFVEWGDLTLPARQGRLLQAQYLIAHADEVLVLLTAPGPIRKG